MADASVFEQGQLNVVWSFVGKDSNGNDRYRRAPFDILNWSSDAGYPQTYIVPLGLERVSAADVVLKADGSLQIGQEFGYYTGYRFVIDPSQGDGMGDTLQQLHTFGPV